MDMHTLVARMLAPISRRVRLMVARAVITAINDGGKVQTAQVKLLDGEVRDGIEVLGQYGLASVPHGRPEGLYFSVGSDRDHGVLVCVADRQYRLRALESGEVALYDDLGQKVHLTRTGIVIDGGGLPVTITNALKVRAETELFECTGEIKDRCDSGGKAMSAMRSTFNAHTHNETQSVTAAPNQSM